MPLSDQVNDSVSFAEKIIGRRVLLGGQATGTGTLSSRSILVTGAGGSVGTALCKSIAACNPSRLIMLDRCESALHRIEARFAGDRRAIGSLVDIRDTCGVEALLRQEAVDVVLHAAAHKHVPMAERDPIEYIRNNVEGTLSLLHAAKQAGSYQFLLVSSDKAIDPAGVMGATKRLAEQLVLATTSPDFKCSAVRFGNVFGSSGSVIEGFQRQWKDGRKLQVTDPRMTRFFMTASDAAHLIVRAVEMSCGGEIFSLELGEPVSIVDLARRFINVMSHGEIGCADDRIEFTSMRAGERLHEPPPCGIQTEQPGILSLVERKPDIKAIQIAIDELRHYCDSGRAEEARSRIMELTHRSATCVNQVHASS